MDKPINLNAAWNSDRTPEQVHRDNLRLWKAEQPRRPRRQRRRVSK